MTDNDRSESSEQRDGALGNAADRDINVGAQAGIIVGDVYATFGHDGTASGKYKTAVEFLRSSAGRTAARLIKDAVDEGFRGGDAVTPTEIAYQWALAVLSDRSYEQLDSNDLEDFDRARKLAKGGDNGNKYLIPLSLISKLFDSLQRQVRGDGPDATFGELSADYERLTEQFKEDFQRHLALMLAGGIDDNLEEILVSNAEQQRMSDGRRIADAWKFFEAEPEKPRRRDITRPDMAAGRWGLVGFGILAGLLGLVLAGRILLHGGLLRITVVAIFIVLGGAGAAWCLVNYQADVERLADRERDFGGWRLTRYSTPHPTYGDPQAGLPDDVEDDDEAEKARKIRTQYKTFVRMTTSFINEQFRKHSPTSQSGRRRWAADTNGLKESLKAELLALYKDPYPAPASLNWLIAFRVGEIARRWRDGTLRDFRKQMRPHPAYLLGGAVGAIAAAAALVYGLTLTGIAQPVQALLSVLSLLVAGFALVGSHIDVYLVRLRRFEQDQADVDAQHEAEMAQYQRWVDQLRGRPSDADMARWLDYDKLYLRKLVMSQLGLVNRDILSHATLTEPAPGCTLARWRYGPPRATVYHVTVFLLTRAGVRQVRTRLNFRNGDVYNQLRRSFRYDAIVSATVNETGVRYDSGRRHAISPGDPWTKGHDASRAITLREEPQRALNGSVILSQDFQLSLGNRDEIRFLNPNFGNWGDLGDEDPLGLLDLALDTSGIAAALEVLEAISGHGAQWVEERIRRRRRWTTAEGASA